VTAIVVLCVFVFAAGWFSCAAVRALAGDRDEARLRARLPRCGMVTPDGSERRTCSCLGPADCQPDVKQLSLDLRGSQLRDLPARQLTERVDTGRTRRGYPCSMTGLTSLQRKEPS
jgi:hypothetical protein